MLFTLPRIVLAGVSSSVGQTTLTASFITHLRTIMDRMSGVSLVDAVAASCAVPGIWPPVTIAGRRYMDG
jgi:predicted acylesterase/phospholipase RssA